jgi:hypothetical protein
MANDASQPLRLLAQDAEDLAVLSAHMQDAVIRAGDMAFLPKSRRFALAGCRFDWLAAEAGRKERCHVGLHFEGVLAAASTGFDPGRHDDVLNLLSIEFTPSDAPSGDVLLTFSAGAAVRLRVECLEAQLRDLGPRWQTKMRPGHADGV